MLPLFLENKMTAAAASDHAQTPAKRDPRLYFWIASTGTALIGVALYLLAPTPNVALYSLFDRVGSWRRYHVKGRSTAGRPSA
jgi:hypothetical protein